MKISFYEDAVLDVDNIEEYYKNISGAERLDKKFLLALNETLDTLTRYPEIGSNRFSYLFNDDNSKSILIKNFSYILFYCYTKKEIKVDRILHTSRDINNILFTI